MKTMYGRPTLLVYGRLSALTLGSGGTLPDINQNQNVVNNNCLPQTSAGFTVTSCNVVTAGS